MSVHSFQSLMGWSIATTNINSFQTGKTLKLKEKGQFKNINEKTLYILADTRINYSRIEKVEKQFKKDEQGNKRFHTTISKPRNPKQGASILLPIDMAERILAVRTDEQTEEEPRFIAIVIKTTTQQKLLIAAFYLPTKQEHTETRKATIKD